MRVKLEKCYIRALQIYPCILLFFLELLILSFTNQRICLKNLDVSSAYDYLQMK